MTARRDSPLGRAVGGVAFLLILAWTVGGQSTLGRIDPALALPWMPLPALLLAWLQRHTPPPARRRTIGLGLALLAIAQALLALALSARTPWPQVALAALGWALILVLADVVLQRLRGKIVALLLAVTIAAGWFAGSHWLLATLYRPAAADGPPATVLTGLPLRWSAAADLSAMLTAGLNEDPVLVRLDAAGPTRLVDSVIDSPPPRGGALFLAHPRAVSPQELVAIDRFVREGGRAVILADALTSWPMRHPLGDPRNPPITSLLTPLLDHWGVALDAVAATDRRPVPIDIDGARLRLVTAGRFGHLPSACRAYADARVAFCRIGRGTAWLVGDADLLFGPLWQPAPRWAAHLRRADTMEWLARQLWPDAPTAALQPLWIRAAAE